MHYRINVRSTKTAIPFPQDAKKGDTASVYFPSNATNQLVHDYRYDGKQWHYTGYRLIDLSSNN